MTTAPAQEQPSDAELITAVRAGSADAYALLYARHRAAAYNLARQLTRSTAEVDDLVSEAFAKLLVTLRSGGGPDTAFRAYLLTALRHGAYDRTRRDRKVEFSDDVAAFDPGVPFADTAVAGLERSLAARAFATLPERWQAVLWYTEIEGQAPAEVATLLGLSPNGVSALAYRAREGLRQAYLQVHLADTAAAGGELDRCQAAVDRLGAWTRDGLSKRETAQVEQHLDECDRCRALAAELADVNGGLRAFVAPLVLGTAAAAYLASSGAKATAATVGTVATIAAGGGGTSSGGGSGLGGAIASAPRQLVAVAGSAGALAAAIAVGLLAGPVEPAVPNTATAPPTAATSPARPPAVPPSPPSPAPSSPGPSSPGSSSPAPSSPPSSPDVPTEPPGASAPAADQPAAPAPAATSAAGVALAASSPTAPIELVVGGDPVSLPIAVRNTGSARSDPVVVRLTLPTGITATASGTAVESGSTATATAQGGDVSCNGSSGTVRCTTGRGVDPGERVTFVFSLRAGQGAAGGQLTGSVSAGTRLEIGLAPIRVVIRSPDAVDVQAWVHQPVPWHAELYIRAADTGRSSGQVTATVTLPEHVYVYDFWSGCQPRAGTRLVRCTATLTPGEDAVWRLRLSAHTTVRSSATITAVLGTASDSTGVPLEIRPPLTCIAPLICPPP